MEKAKIIEPFDDSQLPTFFKYCGDNENVIKGIFKEHKIRFTQPVALNDPLEFNPIIKFEHDGNNYSRYILDEILFPSEEDRPRINLIWSQLNEFGILSLTKVPDSFDMWSLYANGHKGFLIEFKSDFNEHPCMLSTSGQVYPVREVMYVDEYAINIDELTDANGNISIVRFNEEMFYKKTARWNSEEEYRMVRSLADYPEWKPLGRTPHRDLNMYLFDFSLDCVESITFGARMVVQKKKEIISACKGSAVGFLQACILRDKKDQWGKPGKVILLPIESFTCFLSMLDFDFEQRYVQQKSKPIEIRNLTELPYYEDCPAWAQQVYEVKKAKRKSQN